MLEIDAIDLYELNHQLRSIELMSPQWAYLSDLSGLFVRRSAIRGGDLFEAHRATSDDELEPQIFLGQSKRFTVTGITFNFVGDWTEGRLCIADDGDFAWLSSRLVGCLRPTEVYGLPSVAGEHAAPFLVDTPDPSRVEAAILPLPMADYYPAGIPRELRGSVLSALIGALLQEQA